MNAFHNPSPTDRLVFIKFRVYIAHYLDTVYLSGTHLQPNCLASIGVSGDSPAADFLQRLHEPEKLR
jgi:hypothetical protein